jgi:hypothetical protein
VNGTWAFSGSRWLFGDLFRELGGGSARKGQQFDARSRIAFQEMIDERYERGTFPGPRTC